MSEQYRCKTCGYTFDMKDVMCSECGIGYFERLHWTKGGDGSHWDGCEDVHWDCKIAQLEADLARRDASLLTEGEQKEILSYIRGNYDRDKIPTWLLDLIDGIARRDDLIKRLVEDGERLASTYVIEVFPHEWVCRGGCHHWARFGEHIEHSPDCPVTMHRALMKELE